MLTLKDNPIAQKNLSKFQLVKKSKRSNAAVYMLLDGYEYKLTPRALRELQYNITNERFTPTWLLTPHQAHEHFTKRLSQGLSKLEEAK